MASTYSTNLGIELIGSGEQSGTWGTTTNNNLGTLLEQAICGYGAAAVTTGNTTTITMPNGASGTARNMVISVTGTGGASTVLAVPDSKTKIYTIFNGATGAITVRTVSGSGISVPTSTKAILYCDGTNVVDAVNYFSSLTLGAALPVASGGTGASSLTAYAVYTGNSAGTGFTPVAPGASGNVLTSNGTNWASTTAGVTSFSAGTTGLTPSTTTTGAVTLAGTLAVANGGTGAATATAYAVQCGGTTSTGAYQSVASVGTSGQILTSNGAAALPTFSEKIVQGTAVATTSGTSANFTGIPSYVKRITVMFSGVSTSGVSNILLQLGTSAGVVSTGYLATSFYSSTTAVNNNNSTAGFNFDDITAAGLISGTVVVTALGSNMWVANGFVKTSTTSSALTAGDITLGGTLDRVRITTANGTDTFDAGTINILYE